MNTAEYATMYELEAFYWWFVARRKLLQWFVRTFVKEMNSPRVLDVGTGTGINFSFLRSVGKVFSCDSSQEALFFAKARGVERLVCCRAEKLAFVEDSFDLVTALDVLEHTDDDLQALQEVGRVAKPGGLLLVTVPAYGFLWSEHDEALHHRRRYASSELRNKLTNSGFEVERITYYIAFLFFPILFVRFVQNLFKKSVRAKTSHIILPGWLNSLLIKLLDCERWLLSWINFPFGVSLVCLARKAVHQYSSSDSTHGRCDPTTEPWVAARSGNP